MEHQAVVRAQIGKICAQADKASAGAVYEEIRGFKPLVFNWWQRILDLFIRYTPLFALRRKSMENQFFTIIAHYGPRISDELRTVKENFDRWENENRSPSHDSSSFLKAEHAAKKKAVALTAEATQKLTVAGYSKLYQPIKEVSELIRSPYMGHISIEMGLIYWEGLEKFFNSRVN